MKTSTFNQVTATAQAVHRAVMEGGDRFKVVLNAIRTLGKDTQRKNRQNIAVALFTASTHRDPDAVMEKAMGAACKAADEVFHASLLLATMSALPELRVEPVSPLVLPVGEAKTFTPIHNSRELLHVLSSDPELQESLMKQGASRLKAKGLVKAAQFAAANREVVRNFADNLMFLGQFAKDKHAVRINRVKYNMYALASFEAVKDAAAGLEVPGGSLAKGLAALAQYAVDEAVSHAAMAEDALPTAIRFWIAEGGSALREVGKESGYANAPDTLIRAPFYGTTNLGQNPDAEEVTSTIQANWEECRRIGVEFMAYAKELDAMLGAHAVYRLRAGGEGTLADVIFQAEARREAARAKREAARADRIRAKARDRADLMLAALDGLNAAQKAQVKKMAEAMNKARLQEDMDRLEKQKVDQALADAVTRKALGVSV